MRYSCKTQNHNAIPLSVRKVGEGAQEDRRGRQTRNVGTPDDVILGVLRARLIEGLTKQAAAAKYGVDLGSAENWFRGYNKAHLLDQVMSELGK